MSSTGFCVWQRRWVELQLKVIHETTACKPYIAKMILLGDWSATEAAAWGGIAYHHTAQFKVKISCIIQSVWSWVEWSCSKFQHMYPCSSKCWTLFQCSTWVLNPCTSSIIHVSFIDCQENRFLLFKGLVWETQILYNLEFDMSIQSITKSFVLWHRFL